MPKNNENYLIVLIPAIIIILTDQISKFIIRYSMELNSSIPLIKNFLHMTYVTNTGSAFGLFKDKNILFIILSLIVAAVILYYINKINARKELITLGIILGGTIGNLVDRIILGHVTDFIDFRIWPVFNIADSAITIGVLTLVFYLWNEK